MQGIVAMTDAVGGIEVCFEEAIYDENSGLDVEAGCQTLNGEEALAWVRMRYADPKGDLGRIERQRQYMALMVDELDQLADRAQPVPAVGHRQRRRRLGGRRHRDRRRRPGLLSASAWVAWPAGAARSTTVPIDDTRPLGERASG